MALSTESRSTARINPYTAILSTVSSEHLHNGAVKRNPKYCENKPIHRHFVHGEFGASTKWRRQQKSEVLRE